MDLKKPLILLVVFVLLLVGLSVVSGMYAFAPREKISGTLLAQDAPVSPGSPTPLRTAPPQPLAQVSDMIDQQDPRGFQALASYVDGGFEPVDITIRKGDIVRFTNNSTRQLWVAASGPTLYPALQNGCGSSALDSCSALLPGEYWEFRFAVAGTWGFQNNLNKDRAGMVKVQ